MAYGCHFSMRYLGISLLSRGPTWTFQPLSSSISPLMREALPGMIIFRCLTFCSMPEALIASATRSAVILRPATPLSIAEPSV
jgi:hypothetical protein